MMSDVRLEPTILLPRSYQNSLYGMTLPGRYCAPPFRVDQVAILTKVFFALERDRLLVGKRLLAHQTARAFERRDRAEIPDALEIELAINGPRWRPVARGLRARSTLSDDDDAATDHHDEGE
jgi:hypothetical protein